MPGGSCGPGLAIALLGGPTKSMPALAGRGVVDMGVRGFILGVADAGRDRELASIGCKAVE